MANADTLVISLPLHWKQLSW